MSALDKICDENSSFYRFICTGVGTSVLAIFAVIACSARLSTFNQYLNEIDELPGIYESMCPSDETTVDVFVSTTVDGIEVDEGDNYEGSAGRLISDLFEFCRLTYILLLISAMVSCVSGPCKVLRWVSIPLHCLFWLPFNAFLLIYIKWVSTKKVVE